MRPKKKGFFSKKNKSKQSKPAYAPPREDFDEEDDDLGLYEDETEDFFDEEFVEQREKI